VALATSCAPRTSEKDASLAAVLTEHDPGLGPEKSAKSTLCLDAALLCSRAPAGMRDAARAAWVAIVLCCQASQTKLSRRWCSEFMRALPAERQARGRVASGEGGAVITCSRLWRGAQ